MGSFTFADSLPITIEAGREVTIPVNCSFVYVSELVGGSVVMTTGQGRVPLILGRRVEFKDKEVGGIRLKNSGDSSAVMVLIVGSGDIRDSNVVGTVSVVDGSVKRSEQGHAWQVSSGVAAVAGKYPTVEIKNKSGVKDIVVNQIVCQHDQVSAGYISVRNFTEDYGSVWAGPSINKLVGGSDTDVVGYESGNSDTILGGKEYFSSRAVQDELLIIPITEPYVVEPGQRLGLQCMVTNAGFRFVVGGYIK